MKDWLNINTNDYLIDGDTGEKVGLDIKFRPDAYNHRLPKPPNVFPTWDSWGSWPTHTKMIATEDPIYSLLKKRKERRKYVINIK